MPSTRWGVAGVVTLTVWGAAAPAFAQAPATELDGEARATWRYGRRNGRRGASDVDDWRVSRLIAFQGRALGHPALNAALTLRGESDLDGVDDTDGPTDPFRDLTNDRGGSHVAELVQAWVELGDLRVGRQATWAAGRSWHYDGARWEWRPHPAFGLSAYGGRQVSTFADLEDDWLGGATVEGEPWVDGQLQLDVVTFRGTSSLLTLRQSWHEQWHAEARWALRDEHHESVALAVDWLPVTGAAADLFEARIEWRRRDGKRDEVDRFDPTEGQPGDPPDSDLSHLRWEPLSPFERYAAELAWLPGGGVELTGELAWRRLLDRDDQDLYDWTGWEGALGLRWQPARDGWAVAAEWSRGSYAAPRPKPSPQLADPATEAIRARDAVTAGVEWWWQAPHGHTGQCTRWGWTAGVVWSRYDYRSLLRQLRDVNALALEASIEARWLLGAWLRLTYTYEDDFAVLDDETADLHYLALTTGWRF